MRLTLAERAAFHAICVECWDLGRGLTIDELVRELGTQRRVVQKAIDGLLAANKVYFDGISRIVNTRALQEFENSSALVKERRDIAAKAASARWKNHASSNASSMHQACIKHASSNASSNADLEPDLEPESKKYTSARQGANQPVALADFERFKSVYPRRSGSQPWSRAVKAANARIKGGATFESMVSGAIRYRNYCQKLDKTGTEFVMQAATFLGPEQHFLANWEHKNGNRRQSKFMSGVRKFVEAAGDCEGEGEGEGLARAGKAGAQPRPVRAATAEEDDHEA